MNEHIMIRTHGPSGYNRGCRCDQCREANTERTRTNGHWKNHITRLRASLVVIDGRPFAPNREGLHGRMNTYVRYGCRCLECTQVKADRDRGRAR